MNVIPARKSGKWLFWTFAYWLLLSLLLEINRFVVLGQTFDAVIALRFVMLAFILSLVVNGFGWLGARWVWLITTIALVIGLMLMFVYVTKDLTGWEDLISLLAFGEAVVIGFVAGLAVEAIVWIKNSRRKPI
jgi:hypothetical protein